MLSETPALISGPSEESEFRLPFRHFALKAKSVRGQCGLNS